MLKNQNTRRLHITWKEITLETFWKKNKVKVSLVYHKLNLDIVSGKKDIKWGVCMYPNRKRKNIIKICQISIIVLK